jgi:glyoxylase-like metal-dependent hydrolase (beta-lactamase superfamily II)
MSEPKNHAKKITRIAPGVHHWSIHDDRIDAQSDAYSVEQKGKTILIDPLPLEEAALKDLGSVEAICLTGSCHQRSAWRYRKELGVKVYAPEGAQGLEEEPDVWYKAGDALPGGLKAIHAPGPTEVHYAFLSDRGTGALFCADVLMRDGDDVRFVTDEYQDDPKRTRETAKRFLELKIGALCFAHGDPITREPHSAIREALKADREK